MQNGRNPVDAVLCQEPLSRWPMSIVTDETCVPVPPGLCKRCVCLRYQSLNLICDGGVFEQEDAPAELTLEGTSALGLAMHVDLFRKITSVQKG